jgi:hypothetical protein
LLPHSAEPLCAFGSSATGNSKFRAYGLS